MAINISLDDTLSQIKVQAQEGLQQILKENQDQWEKKLQEKQEHVLKGINPDCIKLNVGGNKFITTKTILMNFPDSKLAKIITGRYPLMFDHKKRIFIDRNGEYFGYVLDCVREGKVNLPLDGPLRKRIEAELKFFDIIEKPVIKEAKVLAKVAASSGSFSWKLSAQGNLNPSDDKLELQASSSCGFTVGEKEFKFGTQEWRFLFERSTVTTSGGEAFGVFGIVEANVWKDMKSGYEDYSSCYGYSTNGQICVGMNDPEDDGAPIGLIPLGSEIKIVFNPAAMRLTLEHKKGGEKGKTMSIEGVPQGTCYPFFFVNDAKITLLETK